MTLERPRHPIRVVAERTGLTPATLRAWERRYAAISPARSGGAQRLYSDHDIQRLRLIARLSAVGYPLAELAEASTKTLATMTDQPLDDAESETDEGALLQTARATAAVTRMIGDARALDAPALRATLKRAVMTLGPLVALELVVSPFLRQVGVGWACSEITVAQEHLASAVVRDVLGWLLETTVTSEGAPCLIASTIRGERHEFGAMMAAVAAGLLGWRVLYLGPDLPAREIARLARDAGARVIALGVVNDQVTRALRAEFAAVRKGAGHRMTIVGGGAGTAEHQLTMRRAGIRALASREELRAVLDDLWTAPT